MVQLIAENYKGTKEHPIPIGRKNEHLTRTLIFKSLVQIRNSFPPGDGIWAIIVQRPGDKAAYIAGNTWESEEGYACWDVSNIDTKTCGLGQVELRYYPKTDNKDVYKTITRYTFVRKSLVEEEGSPQSPYDEYEERLNEIEEALEQIHYDVKSAYITMNGIYRPVDFMADYLSEITINVEGGTSPTGIIDIEENGIYNVTLYSQANVSIPDPSLSNLSVSSNGIYRASDYDVYGFGEVEVSTPVPSGTKEITENGIYDITSFASAFVSVPQGVFPTGTSVITSNGIYDVSSYSSASVSVPQGVFPSGTKNITENGIYTISSFYSVSVSVSGLVPTGTKQITSNGIYDVTSFASASVSVSQGVFPSGTRNITSNGLYTISSFYSVSVSVSQGVFPEGTLIISQNGIYNVGSYLSASVSVSGGGGSAQSKTVTPSLSSQTILPDSGYDYLSMVVVESIPYTEVDNEAGGVTVIIAPVS